MLLHLAVLGYISQRCEAGRIEQHSVATDVRGCGALGSFGRVGQVLSAEREGDGEVRWPWSFCRALFLGAGGGVGRVEWVDLVDVAGGGGEWLGLMVVLELRLIARELFLQSPPLQRPLRP